MDSKKKGKTKKVKSECPQGYPWPCSACNRSAVLTTYCQGRISK